MIFNKIIKKSFVFIFALILCSCQTVTITGKLPELTTKDVTNIGDTTALSGGNVVTEGDSPVTVYGVCWSATITKPTIDINGLKTIDGKGLGGFTSKLLGLSPNTSYYLRAYATTKYGTGYGNVVEFKTTGGPSQDTTTIKTDTSRVITSAVYGIMDHSASVYAYYRDNPKSTCGVCWSTHPNPTVKDFHFNESEYRYYMKYTNTFILGGLMSNTKYYVRSYIPNYNDNDIVYGKEIQFTTEKTIDNGIQFNPNLSYGTVNDIDGNVYKTIKIGTQTWMAENLRTTRYQNGSYFPPYFCEDCPAIGSFYLNALKFGKLYNFEILSPHLSIAPVGWHIPSDMEWDTLIQYLINNGYNSDGTTSGNKIAKSLSSTSDWKLNPNIIGDNLDTNNSSGFTALPCGYFNWFFTIGWPIATSGGFGTCTYFHSSGGPRSNTTGLEYKTLEFNKMSLNSQHYPIGYSHSVRCIKDSI